MGLRLSFSTVMSSSCPKRCDFSGISFCSSRLSPPHTSFCHNMEPSNPCQALVQSAVRSRWCAPATPDFAHSIHHGASARWGKETAGPSTSLPRIFCRAWWRWRTSCGFLYGKPHTRPLPVLGGRKSGYAPAGMTKVGKKCPWVSVSILRPTEATFAASW